MKKTTFSMGLLLLVALTSRMADAKEFSIEGNEWRDAPPEVTRLFEAHDAANRDEACRPLQMLPPEQGSKVGVVIPQVACWGARNAPIWLVELGPSPKLLADTSGYGIRLKPKANGYFDLLVSDGAAAYYSNERWHFNGKKYVRVFREDRCADRKSSKDGNWGAC
jgi:hypothetical protein